MSTKYILAHDYMDIKSHRPFAKEFGLGILEQKKFVAAVERLKQSGPQKTTKPARIVITEVEEKAMDNIKHEENKYEEYIENIKGLIENTKNNAENCKSLINQEFEKMNKILNDRKINLENELKEIENRKLKIYNNNLNIAMNMKKELQTIQIKFDELLGNIDVNRTERKNKITSQSETIINKSINTMKNDIVQSVNDAFNVKFDSTKNFKVQLFVHMFCFFVHFFLFLFYFLRFCV